MPDEYEDDMPPEEQEDFDPPTAEPPPPPPPPPPQPRRYTLDEARARAAELETGTFLIYIHSGPSIGNWYRDPGNGNTPNRDQAWRYNYRDAVHAMEGNWNTDSVRMEELEIPAPDQPRNSEVQPIRLTQVQLLDNMEVLSRKQTLVFLQGSGYFKEPLGSGYTDNKDMAMRCSCQSATQYGGMLFELIDQEAAAEILKRKCSITTLLGKSLVELLKAAPLNPTGRARILAISGLMPPDTITTYDELKAWVENNCEPKKQPGRAGRPAPAPAGIQVRVRFQEDETGTCNYYVTNTASAIYHLSPELIARCLEGATNLGAVTNNVFNHIQAHARDEIDPSLDPNDAGYSYDEYNNANFSNERTELRDGGDHLQQQIIAYLRTNNPQLLRQLQNPF